MKFWLANFIMFSIFCQLFCISNDILVFFSLFSLLLFILLYNIQKYKGMEVEEILLFFNQFYFLERIVSIYGTSRQTK